MNAEKVENTVVIPESEYKRLKAVEERMERYDKNRRKRQTRYKKKGKDV